jgi:hypothetical protein
MNQELLEQTTLAFHRDLHLGDQEEETPDTGGCIAIDANPYNISVAFTSSDANRLIDTVEAKPHQIARVTRFVRKHKRYHPDLHLTGVRTDRWPPGLQAALALEFGPVLWIPDILLKHTQPEFRRTIRCIRFLRAMFLATCSLEAINRAIPAPKPEDVLNRWKTAAFDEMSSSFYTGFLEDIPF